MTSGQREGDGGNREGPGGACVKDTGTEPNRGAVEAGVQG